MRNYELIQKAMFKYDEMRISFVTKSINKYNKLIKNEYDNIVCTNRNKIIKSM